MDYYHADIGKVDELAEALREHGKVRVFINHFSASWGRAVARNVQAIFLRDLEEGQQLLHVNFDKLLEPDDGTGGHFYFSTRVVHNKSAIRYAKLTSFKEEETF